MKAVVLAGGKGTRLRPITLDRPKPLVPVAGVPILDRIIDSLPPRIEEVLLACNFKENIIQDYYSNSSRDVDVKVLDEPKPLGTGGAIKNAEDHIEDDEDFLVFNGDILSSLDISDFLDFHVRKGGIGTISLWEVDDPTRYGIIGTDKDNRITKFVEKPDPDEVFSNMINAGVYAFNSEVLDFIPSGKKVSIEREVFPKLVEEGLYGFGFDGYWIDIGTPTSYLEAHQLVVSNDLAEPNTNARETVGSGSFVADSAVIDEESKINSSVIFPDVEVGKNTKVKNSIVCSGTKIENDVTLNDCTVGDNCIIQEGTTIGEGVRIWNGTQVSGTLIDKTVLGPESAKKEKSYKIEPVNRRNK